MTRLTTEQRQARDAEQAEARFLAAVHLMERQAANVCAYAVIDPTNPQRWGRVALTWGRGNAVVNAVAWLPGEAGRMDCRHAGKAGGGGYDRRSAAMDGAPYVAPDGTRRTINGSGGIDWRRQLEDAGFIVIQAV